MAKNSELRIQLGLAIAELRLHPDASREIFLWLQCYEYQTIKSLDEDLVQALIFHHKDKQGKAIEKSCPYFSGRDEFPDTYMHIVARITSCMTAYFDEEEQYEIAKRLWEKI